MPKGYWVVFADIIDPEGYKEYVAANGPALAKYGARFLARGGQVEPKEGQPKSRVVVVEFPTYRAALDCYHSPRSPKAMTDRSHFRTESRGKEGRPIGGLNIAPQ
jgi:uncharacterized protein (DUF1330 family)